MSLVTPSNGFAPAVPDDIHIEKVPLVIKAILISMSDSDHVRLNLFPVHECMHTLLIEVPSNNAYFFVQQASDRLICTVSDVTPTT